MKTKILIYIILCILLSSFASAVDEVSYWNLFNLTDQWGSNNLTASGSVTNVDYPVFNISGNSSPSSAFFDGINDKLTSNSNIVDVKTLSFWIKLDTQDKIDALFGHDVNTNPYIYWYQNSNNNDFKVKGDNAVLCDFGSKNKNIGSWINIVVVVNGTHTRLYFNGTLNDTVALGCNLDGFNEIGGRISGGTDYFIDGLMDEIKVFNKTLNDTEILNLYNYGVITAPTPSVSNFTITAQDSVTGNPIQNFTATIIPSGYDPICYQESANISNQTGIDGTCGLTYNGEYGFQDVGTKGYFLINYTIPSFISSATLRFKGGQNTIFKTVEENLTIPNSCLVNNGIKPDNTLMLVITSEASITKNQVTVNCLETNIAYPLILTQIKAYNLTSTGFSGRPCGGVNNMADGNWGTSSLWNDGSACFINTIPTDNIGSRIYEEAIYWNIIKDFNTTSGSINTGILQNDTNLYDITVSSTDYFNSTYNNWNVSNNLLANLTFAYYNNSATFSDPVLELDYQTQTMIINTSSLVLSTTASLDYNGTTITPTKTTFSNYILYTATFITPKVNVTKNVTFTWNYNITTATTTYTHSDSYQQEVIIIGVDNCSTYTTQAINFSLRDQTTDALVLGNLAGYFSFTPTGGSGVRSFNLTWADAKTFGVCINPASANFLTNAQMQYGATNYTTKTYYLTNYDLDNVTDYIDLILTENTTQVTFTVTDENDNDVPNVYINVLAYDLTTNSSSTVEILKTDSDGQAIGNIILNTQWYKFILTYKGNIVLETDPTIITSTSRSFRINLEENFFDNYDLVNGVSCDITFNNVTNIFSYVFSDPTGNVASACLTVKKYSINGVTIINKSCLSTSAGTISLGIGTPGIFTYIGSGNVVLNGETFVCGLDETADFDITYKTFGKEGIFYSFLLVLTMTMIGIFAPPVAIILMMVSMFFIVVMGIMHFSWAVLVAFFILGGVTLYKVSRT